MAAVEKQCRQRYNQPMRRHRLEAPGLDEANQDVLRCALISHLQKGVSP
jgi:hypothetical protein